MFITINDGKEIQMTITSKNGLSNFMNLKMLFVSKVYIGKENTSMVRLLAPSLVVGWMWMTRIIHGGKLLFPIQNKL